MLFNSYIFIGVFLPTTLIGFYILGHKQRYNLAQAWLVFASLLFYATWHFLYVSIILGSIVFNYLIARYLSRSRDKSTSILLTLSVIVNLGVLGYFKYYNFFVDNLNLSFGFNYSTQAIVLPLAISFFTFQQISYLVESAKKKVQDYSFLQYCLFVTFFPQLIAGPIVHSDQLIPQFSKSNTYKVNYDSISIGIILFVLGLTKKVILADSIAPFSDAVFDNVQQLSKLSFLEAWGGALAYTFQLYFDFSGYSDMAIGLGCMFGVLLPKNFDSPYKSSNIIEFWRRWHITLSNFLRDYIYIPMGGARKGIIRKHINITVTMLIGGLWHGAGWHFIFWGFLHAVYININHFWIGITQAYQSELQFKFKLMIAKILTFICILTSWVFFRADSIQSATQIFLGMTRWKDFLISFLKIHDLGFTIQNLNDLWFPNALIDSWFLGYLWIFVATLIVTLAPNALEILSYCYSRVDLKSLQFSHLEKPVKVKHSFLFGFMIAFLLVCNLLEIGESSNTFLYFNF